MGSFSELTVNKVSSTLVKVSDFSRFPAGRYSDDGPYSGEIFREGTLKTVLAEFDEVIVNLDDVEGYGSSFLEEAFGGLVRKGYFSAEELHQRLKIESSDKAYEREVWTYIDIAEVE